MSVSRPQTRALTPQTRSARKYSSVSQDVCVMVRTRIQKHRLRITAAEHNDELLICTDAVLSPIIDYLRKQSGSLLARRAGNSNCIPLSAVCNDWRRINRACAADWLAGSEKPVVFEWQIGKFSKYLRDTNLLVHNTNLLDSAQFLRGAENFKIAIGTPPPPAEKKTEPALHASHARCLLPRMMDVSGRLHGRQPDECRRGVASRRRVPARRRAALAPVHIAHHRRQYLPSRIEP